ncbi:MAG: fatty acid--CoA ligase [Candidatus Thioglobus sp.]|nr:MAG: fatty acid--CoA ligase [Candidatus Thioglobus sp.]
MNELLIPRTPSAHENPLLIKQLLSRLAAQHGTREIVYAGEKRFTYNEFYQRILHLAGALKQMGISPGDTVAVMDWDSHRYLECFFAVPMIGAVLHTINIRLAPEQVLYTVNHAKDTAILVHDEFLPLLKTLKDKTPTVKKWIRLTDIGNEMDPAWDEMIDFEYEEMLSTADREFHPEDFDESIRATTFYTTGTTGNPKGVYFSQRQIVLHTLGLSVGLTSAAEQGRLHVDDVYMPITPMFHVHAWGLPYVATMLGLKQIYPGRYEPEKLLSLIESEGVTFSHCVPTILHMLLSNPAAERVDLSRWKVIIGGAAMPPALAMRARDLGIDVFGGYGMSETCPVLTLAQIDLGDIGGDQKEDLSLRCKAGRAIPLVDLKVVDAELNEKPSDGEATGEVVVRAPWLTQGYLDDPERSEELWQGGYLHTGDIGHIDSAGYLKVTDRLKDVIKSGGEWISSLELEDIALSCEGISEAAAIGVPHEKWGERPLLLVVATQSGQDLTSTRTAFENLAMEGVLSEWAIPDIQSIDAIPKTSVGKIDKKKLREMYGNLA